ncbi:MAG: alpha-D-glucose phosphate-specific phosphoglucomutase [Terricaulis sp.]
MTVLTVRHTPFTDQRPGTSGLRKTTRTFQQPHYLPSFVQAIFDVITPDGPIVLGGDGRFFCAEAAQIIIGLAAANGCPGVIVGQGGLLSTPAASHLIRQRKAILGIILSASHNPGGPDGDFGVKFNTANGAPEALTDAVFARTRESGEYRTVSAPPVDLSAPGEHDIAGMIVEVVDPTRDYADLMERLFDFDRIAYFMETPGFSMKFDAMHAVTGPYAEEIFERRLRGANVVMRREPLPDFGGGHPDPTLSNAEALAQLMYGPAPPLFGAASDGDGDRHLVLGPSFPVNPSDSLAIMLAHSELIPGYAGRVAGVARSMPTTRAVDAVAAALGVPCFETPTGWKYFGALLDAGKITLCGEESAGAGSDHVREKDGVWAILYWLNMMAATGLSVQQIVTSHWTRFGRHAALRLDLDLPTEKTTDLTQRMDAALAHLGSASELGFESWDEFSYADPVTGEMSGGHGLRIHCLGGGRIVLRLSGTGTTGATLRVYFDKGIAAPELHKASASALTGPLQEAARRLLSKVDSDLVVSAWSTAHRT